MTEDKDKLPSFRTPPVTEVAIGVQFRELENLISAHYGEYRRRVADKYPRLQEQPPLQRYSEEFGGQTVLSNSPVAMFALPPLRRCWFLESDGGPMIQMDSEHFYYNWRDSAGVEAYPRYAAVKGEFLRLWSDFQQFLTDQEIGEAMPSHWEVTYVNHLDKGQGWESLLDLHKTLDIWPATLAQKSIPCPEGAQFSLAFAYPEQLGRLRVILQSAVKQKDHKECILLKLSARGRTTSTETKDIQEYFDIGHEWIVTTFAEVTSKQAHDMWGREQ